MLLFMTMALLEIKSYIYALKGMLCFLIVGLAMGAVLWIGIDELTARGSLFEPFTIGVVDHDGTPELIFLFDFFGEYVIDLEFLEKAEAGRQLASGEIPAFVELPPDFTRDIFYGINSPFTVHVNSGFPLQSNLVQLLASGAIAYLSVSQAGVYATLEYAAEHGLDWGTLLIPVNMAFVQELIRYDDMFTREVIPLITGSPADYFIRRFAVFWHMLSLIALTGFLPGYSPGNMARFKLADIPLWQIIGIKWSGLFAAAVLMSLPIIPFIGIVEALLVSLFISAFGMLTGRLFKQKSACGLFIFFTALAMYFASGGIIPFVFLPRELLPMRWLSVNYWVATGNTTVIFAAAVVVIAATFLSYAVMYFKKPVRQRMVR